MKVWIVSGIAALALATSALAGADNGKGQGKGKGMASDVSAGGAFEKGGASVASSLKGGWGGNAGATGGQVSSGPSADLK